MNALSEVLKSVLDGDAEVTASALVSFSVYKCQKIHR